MTFVFIELLNIKDIQCQINHTDMTPSKWQIFYLDGDISRDRVRDVYIYVREREKQRDRERERSVGLLLIKNPKLIFLSLFKFGLKNCPLKIITYKVYKPVKVVHWSYMRLNLVEEQYYYISINIDIIIISILNILKQ